MQQLTSHIQFNKVVQLIANAVMNNVQDEEESKVERDFESEMNMDMPTNVKQRKERL
jgi:hypothetical protein